MTTQTELPDQTAQDKSPGPGTASLPPPPGPAPVRAVSLRRIVGKGRLTEADARRALGLPEVPHV